MCPPGGQSGQIFYSTISLFHNQPFNRLATGHEFAAGSDLLFIPTGLNRADGAGGARPSGRFTVRAAAVRDFSLDVEAA
jgi:hypothetical protein